MRIVLVPGLLSPPHLLYPLRADLERAGYGVYMFESWPTLTTLQYCGLLRQLRRDGPAVVIGHSLGGLISILAADCRPELFTAVIGLDSFIWGRVSIDVPYYEVRGLLGSFVQLRGADELKHTLIPHGLVPVMPCVRRWVLQKIRNLEDADA